MEEKMVENNNSIPVQIESWYTQWILVERLYAEFAKGYDLTSSAIFVLRTILEQKSECTQKYICETLIYPKQTVSGIVQTLINKGIVGKNKSEEDKRNFKLFLTEKGNIFTVQLVERLQKAEEDAFAVIDEVDRIKFTSTNEALTKALHKTMFTDSKI
jgi:DNA-binding MarR family transcriptional regulator